MTDPPVPGRALYRWLWHTAWSAAARYHRYECDGFERLDRYRPALLVSYHGRPFTMDLFMLMAKMQRELGWMPRGFVLDAVQRIPPLRDMIYAIGSSFGMPSDETMEKLLRARTLFLVSPGGAREAFRPFWRDRYRVDFGPRRGYVRFALQHHLPILPAASTGVDALYAGLNDGYALSHRVFGHGRTPLWIGVGLGGVWPLALPVPVKIRQKIGAPISLEDLRDTYRDERELLDAANDRVTSAIQALLDELAGRVT